MFKSRTSTDYYTKQIQIIVGPQQFSRAHANPQDEN